MKVAFGKCPSAPDNPGRAGRWGNGSALTANPNDLGRRGVFWRIVEVGFPDGFLSGDSDPAEISGGCSARKGGQDETRAARNGNPGDLTGAGIVGPKAHGYHSPV